MSEVIKRRLHGRTGRIVATEYVLPGDLLPGTVRKRIAPSLAACVGCGPAEVSQLLKRRWADLPFAGLQNVARYFRRCTPYSILVSKTDGWLMLRDRPNADFELGCEWFLPPPTLTEIVDAALGQFLIKKNRCLEVFLREFAGFREDVPGYSGYFPRVQDWLPFDQYAEQMGWQVEKTPRVWAHAPVLFESRCGDVIVLDRAGRTAWWDHDDDKFRILCKNFDDFPGHWLKYLRTNYPLSAWDPQ